MYIFRPPEGWASRPPPPPPTGHAVHTPHRTGPQRMIFAAPAPPIVKACTGRRPHCSGTGSSTANLHRYERYVKITQLTETRCIHGDLCLGAQTAAFTFGQASRHCSPTNCQRGAQSFHIFFSSMSILPQLIVFSRILNLLQTRVATWGVAGYPRRGGSGAFLFQRRSVERL